MKAFLTTSCVRAALLVLPGVLASAVPASYGQTNFTLLKSFSGATEQIAQGALPLAGVIQGSDGWLYGTCATGGTNPPAVGTVFKIQTDGAGFLVLHHFSGPDGQGPSAPVVEASDGFLYGTTVSGGISNAGTVFKLARDGSQFAVLHQFTGGVDSKNPRGALIEGSDGYLYGTTEFGNSATRGTIFKIDKSGGDYSIIHIFTGGIDGQQPFCKLLKGSDGWLYGTASVGGSGNLGVVFKLLENGGGYAIIRNFTSGTNGASPIAGVIEASDGWLYGTTQLGAGVSGGGVVFKLDKFGGGYSVIKSFASSGTDLRMPVGELVEAGNGALYGSAPNGGISNKGGIFRLNKDGSDYTVLRHFAGRTGGGDGEQPRMALFRSGDVLYGASQNGGQFGAGSVFILSTNPFPPRALSLSKLDTNHVIQFTGTGATPYTIESSTNLSHWSDLDTVTTPIYGGVSFTNSAAVQTRSFFRVRLY